MNYSIEFSLIKPNWNNILTEDEKIIRQILSENVERINSEHVKVWSYILSQLLPTVNLYCAWSQKSLDLTHDNRSPTVPYNGPLFLAVVFSQVR